MNSPDDYSEDYTEHCAELVRLREIEEAERVNKELQEALEEELMDDPNYVSMREEYRKEAENIAEGYDAFEWYAGVETGRFSNDIPPSLRGYHLDDETGEGDVYKGEFR